MTGTASRFLGLELYFLEPQPVTPAERHMLAYAATAHDYSVSDDSHRTRRRTARALARRGLLSLQEGAEAGWDEDMWVGTLTSPGWNSLWRALGDRHDPGCGAPWAPDGRCTGCGRAERRLDLAAFKVYLAAADDDERAFLGNRGALWCDEHGYARAKDWTTDKTCRRTPASPYHNKMFTRV